MVTQSRQRSISLLALAVSLLAALAVVFAAPSAAEDGAISGVMNDPEGNPIPDVVFNVSNDEGFNETTQSGSDGKWAIAVPGSGSYTVSLDVETLPEGVTLTNPDRSTRTVTLLSNKKTVQLPSGEGNTGG